MMEEHEADLRVYAAFDHVVGGIPKTSAFFLHLDEGEKHSFPDKAV